jgi:diacylglycerol O-acyltransferase
MKRLSGLDAAFLSTETRNMHNHVAGVFIFDPTTIKDGYSFVKFKELVENRLQLLPPFRRRILHVPLKIHLPIWIEDPDFDLDYHIKRLSLPAPGEIKELAELAADIVARPLDLNKPLWEMYVIEGLKDNMIAMITKTHHAAIDGVSGAELTANFLDLTSEPRVLPPEDPPWKPDRIPTNFELVAYALNSLAKHPASMITSLRQSVEAITNVRAQNRMPDASDAPPAPFSAPKTPLNAAISPYRKVAFAEVSLDDVKYVKNAFKGTVNDVVLTICGTALRNYLLGRRALPKDPLVAMVPISVRTEDEKGALGNRVSMMLVSLETHLRDPIKRLEKIHEGTKRAKDQEKAIGADSLTNWFEFASPAVAAQAARFISGFKVFDRLRPLFNVTISNVPGPNFPLYGGGARMVAMYPLGPVVEGIGLNITVMSYMGSMFFGLQACRELVPDVEKIAGQLVSALADLYKAAERKNQGLSYEVRQLPRQPRPGTKSALAARKKKDFDSK